MDYNPKQISMNNRPKLTIDKTTSDKLIEFLGWLFFLVTWLLPIFVYSDLPDEIPMRIDGSGNVSTTGNKTTIFLLPIIGTFSFLLISIIRRYPHTFNYSVPITEDNALEQYTNSTRMLRYLNLSISLTFLLIMHQIIETASSGANSLGAWLIFFILTIVFAPMFYFIRESYKLNSKHRM
jgi:uncharacterized membrane protein